MKSESGSLFTLAAFFAVTSLFAVGGANSAIPEMHRYAVDIQHWLSDRGSSPIPSRWRSSRRGRT
jgi:chromate transporter